MNKIDTFRITGLTVEGFKCFADKQSFNFGGDVNSITGHNGQGKSSIADAIAYAIAGVPFFGNEQSFDRLYTIGDKNASVELDIMTADGAAHKLTRSRVKDVTSITYDGVTIRQTDLTDMFGERDVFLSIFNPLYFIEVLGDKGKNLLERYLPAIPHETVLGQLSESTRATLDGVQMGSPEMLLDRVRSDIRELDSTIIYSEGQRDLLASQAKETTETLQGLVDKHGVLSDKINHLEAKRTQGINLSAMKERQTDLYARYDEMHRDTLSAPDTSEVDNAILAARASLEKRRDEGYVSKFSQQLADIKAGVAQLRTQYTKEKAIHDGLTTGIKCPMCKQEITEQNIASVKNAFTESINGVLASGRDMTAQLAELEELDKKAQAVFEQFREEDIAKLQSQLETLIAKRAEIIADAQKDAESKKAELDRLKSEIQSLELDMENGGLEQDEAWELSGLLQQRDKLSAEITVLAESSGKSGAETKTADIDSLKKSISEKREFETAVKFYIAERTHLMVADFDVLQRVDIVLNEVVKTTGEAKSVFKFSYEDRPYKFLSLSEKIKAGLEIAELMKRLTGRGYPVFIDNGESVPVIDNVRPSGQVFVAQVAKGAPLKVEILGGAAQKAAA